MIRGCLSGFSLALHRLRSQAGLLLILLLTAAIVAVGAGPGLEALFSGEEKLTVIKLGIAGGEEEDELTRKLVSAVTLAADVSDYCSFEALSEEEGRAALERGELTALLLLPEGFVDSVLTGENLEGRHGTVQMLPPFIEQGLDFGGGAEHTRVGGPAK